MRLLTVADDRPGSGPAHGFVSGLHHAPSSDWVCLLTGDLVDNVQHGCRVLSGWLETHHPANDRCGAVLMDRGQAHPMSQFDNLLDQLGREIGSKGKDRS